MDSSIFGQIACQSSINQVLVKQKECITEASRLIIAIFQHLFGYVTIIGMPKSKSKETDKELTDNS